MIPGWSPNGDLPPGVHFATWREIEARLGFNSHRKLLLAGLRRACEELRKAGCRLVYLDGSFASRKEHPADFDACWDLQNVDDSKLAPVFLDFSRRRAAQKEQYLGEILPGPTAGRRHRQGVRGFLPGEQADWGAQSYRRHPAARKQTKVIKNEKQYRITKAQVRRLQDALAELSGQARPSNISPRLWAAQRQAAQYQMAELQKAVEAFERLQLGQSKEVVLTAVEDLPKALIRARIAAGMTQEGLARRLGVKPQQVQRYEATEYESASFARILKVVHALGLRMPKAARLVRSG